MKRILKLLKWVYSATQGVLAALGFYLLLLIVISVVNKGSVGLVFAAPGGFRATATLDALTKGFNGQLFVVVFCVFLIGSLVSLIVFLTRLVKKLKVKHEDSELTKAAAKQV